MAIGKLWRGFAALFQDTGGKFRPAQERPPIDRHYVSEFTAFMNDYLDKHPEVVADQARGRAIYWDRKLNFDELKKEAEDSAPAEPYAYFPLFRRQPPSK